MHHIHIGRLIREELRRQGHTNEWFMERLGVSERTLQRLFHKSSLDTDQLFRISSILGTNFFQHYSEALPPPSNDTARQCLAPQQ
ncbi:MAG: helix-turn-helix transcriptional regulator [Bacteroidales bacterium]|nr:helix-turn-helix transcriptional regulator [Bacteroidales bacterium]